MITIVVSLTLLGAGDPGEGKGIDFPQKSIAPPVTPGISPTPSLRNRIEFFVHNLMQPAPQKDIDCLFLRNVLIYFDKESKETVLRNVTDALRPGGYLVIGPSEGVFHIPVVSSGIWR